MSENNAAAATAPVTEPKTDAAEKVSAREILERIDKIIADKKHIEDAIRILSGVTDNVDGMGTVPHGLSVIVEEREHTNQQMIALLTEMYRDSMGSSASADDEIDKIKTLVASLKGHLPPQETADIIRTAVQQMFVKPGAGIVR